MKKLLYLFLLFPLFLFGQENYSFDFSYGNYGRIPTSETLSNFESFTMEFWYYLEAGHGSDENIVGTELQAGNGFHIYTFQNKLWPYIGDGSSSIGPYNGGPVQGEPYNLNEWYHISYCYDGVDFKFFIDGELVYFESGIINTFGPLNKDIVINRHTWGYGSSSRLTGQIDELRISNISRYYDDFIPPTQEFVPDEFTAGLWHFNNDFNDYSGNNNHGIHVGTSFSENTPIVVNGCTNSSALNYDNFANTDDGSCIIFLGNNDTSYFYISPTPLTWEESNNLSISYDAHLATITSQEENDFITNLISEMESVHAFWLGGIDINGNNDFQWVTGEEFNYTNWNGSEPQLSNDELYLNIWGVNANSWENLGKWNDYDNYGYDAEPHTHALIEVRMPTEFNVPLDFNSIQEAINASNHGDTVFVQSGTYYENLNLNGKNITLIGEDKLTTIIEAEDANSRIVTFNSGENATCVLSGFTLSNNSNGAISVVGANPTLQNLIIKGNSADDGGGIYVYDSQELTINNCELIENSSSGHGGALSIWYHSNVSINNSTFTNNESQTGGGVYSFNSSLDINYSIFNSNLAIGDGGGITISSTSNSQLDMANATMYDNSATTDPESNGIRLAGSGSSANITNSIIWENISGNNFSITYSNIQGQGDDNFEIYLGDGNIAQIPLFNSVDSSNPDYNLTVCSPCIDAGNPEETDPDGSIIDMGALPFITQGYNCDGNIDVEIGDEVFGGVVFYVGEGSDGQYGLVASTDYIGTGTWQQAFDQSASYENNGYTDWYLPYMHELSMIYNELHSTGSNVYNTGDVNNWYWSSEVCDSSSSASDVHFTDGSYNLCNNMSSSMGGVLAIHSFGQVAYGCIDSLAFNFNTETNLDDGSCYPVIEGCMNSIAENYITPIGDLQIDVNTDDGSCLFSAQVFDDIVTTNSNLEEELSVFETIEEEQDYSMSFDGVDDFIDVGNIDIISTGVENEYTVSFWFNLLSMDMYHQQYVLFGDEVSQNNGILFQMHQEWGFGAYTAGDIFNETHYTGFIPSIGIWNYYTVVQNESGIHFYLNGNYHYHLGEELNTETSQPTLIGKHAVDTRFLIGEMNNIITFNRALSEEELQTYMSCPPTGQVEGLVGYWNFNEVSGDTVYDMSANGNHGVIYGAEYSEDVPESYDGCTDENALNYDSSAICDNSSCVYGDELVSNLGVDLSNANDNIDVLTSELGLANESISSLETDLELSEESFSNANDSIDILTSDLGLANDSISSLEAELDLSEENLSIANDSLTSLEFELSNIQSDISLLELQLDSTTNLLIEIQLELEASTYDINILSDSIVSLNDLITSLQEDLSIAISNQEDGIGQVDVDSAYNEGAAIGEEYGYNQGINDGYNQGYEEGESYGYVNGFEEGVASITPEDGISQEDVDAIQNLLDEANITISSLNTSLNLASSSITELEQELLVAMSNQEDGVNQADVDAIQNLLDDANNLISDLNNSLGLANANISDLEEQLSMALENQTEPILINLVEGWNIIGYTLNEPQDAVASLNDITSEIQIVKNNDAAVYWPEFGFNGIGDLIPGQGYQIKVLSNIFDFTYPNVEGQRIELTPTIPQWAIDMELDIHPNDIRTLVRVVNMLGQEVNPENQASGTVLLYLYNDATVEKKIK